MGTSGGLSYLELGWHAMESKPAMLNLLASVSGRSSPTLTPLHFSPQPFSTGWHHPSPSLHCVFSLNNRQPGLYFIKVKHHLQFCKSSPTDFGHGKASAARCKGTVQLGFGTLSSLWDSSFSPPSFFFHFHTGKMKIQAKLPTFIHWGLDQKGCRRTR